jgi:DNA-binding transcriptional regulator GbsR (MarR family)
MNASRPPDPRLAFARLAGEMAQSLSFNRSLGQIYGLLYASDKPQSLEEITRALSVSKGNVSVNVRTLESWGAVRGVTVNGTRQDYYEAETDLKALVLRRLEEGLTRRIEKGLDRLEPILKEAGPEQGALRARAQGAKVLLQRAKKGLRLIKTAAKFL